MFKLFLKNMRKNQKGFTLTELMVVVVIIGILAAIAVPVYNSTTNKANKSSVEANLRTIDSAIVQYKATNNTSTDPTQAQLTAAGTGYLVSWPVTTGVTYEIVGGRGVATIAANTFGSNVAITDQTVEQIKALASW